MSAAAELSQAQTEASDQSEPQIKSAPASMASSPRASPSRRQHQRHPSGPGHSLLDKRKLALLLDVDHTILHATVTKQIPYSLLSIMDDLFFFKMHEDTDGSPVFCLLKLRPWLVPFLKHAHELYDIYICTFGTSQYAQEVRAKLVSLTSHETIKSQVISRENFACPAGHPPPSPPQNGVGGRKKDLRSIVELLKADFAPGMAVLLDDRHDVWVENDAKDNLLKIHPYSFFLGHTASSTQASVDMKPSEDVPQINLSSVSVNDVCLKHAWAILKSIHARFFKEIDRLGMTSSDSAISEVAVSDFVNNPPMAIPTAPSVRPSVHVRHFILRLRNSVLNGLHILFFGVSKDLIGIAELFGARCSTPELPTRSVVTHVVGSKSDLLHISKFTSEPGSPIQQRPAEAFNRNGVAPELDLSTVYIVSYNWLRESIKRYQKQQELPYFLQPPMQLSSPSSDSRI